MLCDDFSFENGSRLKLHRYSSVEAQRADWKFHKPECKALASLSRQAPIATVRLAARILWRRHQEKQNNAAAGEEEEKFWISYAAVESLQSHWEQITNQRMVQFAQMAVLVRCVAQRKNSFQSLKVRFVGMHAAVSFGCFGSKIECYLDLIESQLYLAVMNFEGFESFDAC